MTARSAKVSVASARDQRGHDQRVLAPARAREPLGAVVRRLEREALLREVVDQEATERSVVVDQEHARELRHGTSLRAVAASRDPGVTRADRAP